MNPGAHAESLAAQEITRLGCQVFLPAFATPAYDLVADVGGTLLRIQVKYAADGRVDCRSGDHHTKYVAGAFDYFAMVVDFEDGWVLLLVPQAEAGVQFRVTPERAVQYSLATKIGEILGRSNT